MTTWYVFPSDQSDWNKVNRSVDSVLAEFLPGLLEGVNCPEQHDVRQHDEPNYSATLVYLIAHLNDKHLWTREEIADWLESLDVDLTFS